MGSGGGGEGGVETEGVLTPITVSQHLVLDLDLSHFHEFMLGFAKFSSPAAASWSNAWSNTSSGVSTLY